MTRITQIFYYLRQSRLTNICNKELGFFLSRLTSTALARKLLVALGDRLMVGLQSLDLPIGVRIPVSQPNFH